MHEKIEGDPQIKELCDWIMLNRATDDELRPYCKAIDYISRKRLLNLKYGPWRGTIPVALDS
ncbi:hypothetical protein [Bradyrhizobium sp. ORS 285]|uniref:hypothetical protein n=1 Tax=Bradyrhizobium sp. ORS 285 TaxID=115808 RepID=UPI000B411536|nr:hypothetical protein [Bradyrhizobium sp. ORS 285]